MRSVGQVKPSYTALQAYRQRTSDFRLIRLFHIKPKRYSKGQDSGASRGRGRFSTKVGLSKNCTWSNHSGRASRSSSNRTCLKKSLVSPYMDVTSSEVVTISPIFLIVSLNGASSGFSRHHKSQRVYPTWMQSFLVRVSRYDPCHSSGKLHGSLGRNSHLNGHFGLASLFPC